MAWGLAVLLLSGMTVNAAARKGDEPEIKLIVEDDQYDAERSLMHTGTWSRTMGRMS